MKSVIVVVLFGFLLFACSVNNDDSFVESESGISAKSSDSVIVKLKFGEMLSFQKSFIMMFDSVADARCPEDLICFWEGNAEIKLNFLKDGKLSSYKLNTFPSLEPHEIAFNIYKIKIINLLPIPNSRKPFIPENYVVTLLFLKNK